jgi:hypothetical protein
MEKLLDVIAVKTHQLSALRPHKPLQLSGGEKSRVLLAKNAEKEKEHAKKSTAEKKHCAFLFNFPFLKLSQFVPSTTPTAMLDKMTAFDQVSEVPLQGVAAAPA